jgi:CRP/FNR family transcriptional regulator, cyclic AMP receptor protein
MTSREPLKRIPLFQCLTDDDLNSLARSIRQQSLKQGQTLFHKGDEGTALYIILAGTIKIILPSRIGDEMIVSMFAEGDYFGEMALLDGEPRSADAVAVQPTEVLILRRNDFLAFLQSNLNATKAILALLSRRLRKTDDLLEDTCFLNVSARLSKKIVELSHSHGYQKDDSVVITLHLTQKELGDMVGATRESINKELKILKEKKLIHMAEGVIEIKDIQRLKRRAR